MSLRADHYCKLQIIPKGASAYQTRSATNSVVGFARSSHDPFMTDTRHLFGFHAVIARLRAQPQSVRGLYVGNARHDRRVRELIERAETVGVTVHAVDDARLEALAGNDKHQGVVAVVVGGMAHQTLDDVLENLAEPPLLLVLDGVTDPHNLGACLRGADAFGAHAVIVPKDRAVGVNATVAKAASGAADTVPVISVTNLARSLRDLKERGVWMLGAEAGGAESLFDADLSGPIAWVLGAEGTGLRRLTRESCDRIVSIPLLGTVGSLNVSVAAGICLFATRRQRALGAQR
jgi:23S rRNA (guanosine2251-2'-O)-methyltransferase